MNDQTPELCHCGHEREQHFKENINIAPDAVMACACCDIGDFTLPRARVAPDTDALPFRYELEEAAEKFVEAHLHDKENYTCAELMAAFAHTVANERLGWVPVSEKLPDNGSYLVTIIDPDDQSVTVRSLSFMGGWEDDELVDIFGVIAWQPLPEPYKQGE